MFTKRHLLPVAFLALLPLAAQSARAADTPPLRLISTTGNATVYVVPDSATISFGVQTFNKDLDKAQKDNQAACSGMIKAIKDAGIKEDQITTDTLTMSIVYDQNERRQNQAVILGYTAYRGYSIKITDPKLIEATVNAALKNGANSISSLTWECAKLRTYKDQARSMAAKAAKEKAAAIAKDLDAALGKVQTVNESLATPYYPMYGINNMAQNGEAVAGPAGVEDQGAVPAGKIAIRATITASWNLE